MASTSLLLTSQDTAFAATQGWGRLETGHAANQALTIRAGYWLISCLRRGAEDLQRVWAWACCWRNHMCSAMTPPKGATSDDDDVERPHATVLPGIDFVDVGTRVTTLDVLGRDCLRCSGFSKDCPELAQWDDQGTEHRRPVPRCE